MKVGKIRTVVRIEKCENNAGGVVKAGSMDGHERRAKSLVGMRKQCVFGEETE